MGFYSSRAVVPRRSCDAFSTSGRFLKKLRTKAGVAFSSDGEFQQGVTVKSTHRGSAMYSRTLTLCFLLAFVTAPLLARDKTDVLVMKNGDRMSCEVKGLEDGILQVSFDYIDGTTS